MNREPRTTRFANLRTGANVNLNHSAGLPFVNHRFANQVTAAEVHGLYFTVGVLATLLVVSAVAGLRRKAGA